MSFFKKLFGSKPKPESSGAAALNPINNENINVYRTKNYNQKPVFLTGYDSANSKKKVLIPAPDYIFNELNKNTNRNKNHKNLPIKSLLIKNEKIKSSNFDGVVKIWLIFNQTTQMLDYIIQIIPEAVFDNNSKSINVKNLIKHVLDKIHCKIILKSLKKFGINVDEDLAEECKNFRWSFHVSNITINQSNIAQQAKKQLNRAQQANKKSNRAPQANNQPIRALQATTNLIRAPQAKNQSNIAQQANNQSNIAQQAKKQLNRAQQANKELIRAPTFNNNN